MADKTFKEMVQDLTDLKIPQKEIGAACGLAQTTISDVLNRSKGKRVHYETYAALKKFHAAQLRRKAA